MLALPNKYHMMINNSDFYTIQNWLNKFCKEENMKLISVSNNIFYFENLDYKEATNDHD